jgi:PAS domain S-box-containing protein
MNDVGSPANGQTNEHFRLIFQSIGEGILVQSADGHLLLANDAAARLCGYPTAGELLAAPIQDVLGRYEIFDEQGQPFPLERLPARRALAGEPDAEALMRFKIKGRSGDRWAISKATPLRDPGGAIVSAISVFHDVTERRRLVERLQFLSDAGDILGSSLDYEDTLASVARLAVPRIADWCAVDVLEEGGKVRRLAAAHADPERVAWAQALNERYPVDLTEARGIGAVLRTGQPDIVHEITDALLAAGVRDPEYLAMVRSLGLKSYMCIPLVARGKTLGALTVLTTDESDRLYYPEDLTMAVLLGRRAGLCVENARLYTQTDTALRQAHEISRLKDEFLATLSHELRTPLNAILGWSQLLKTPMEDELVDKAIETIHRNAQLQSQLIGDILDVSRIITGKLRLELVAVDAAAVIGAAVDTVKPTADAKGVAIETVVDGEATVSGDADRLQQIVWNLLSNAIKFAPVGGHVTIRVCATNAYVDVSVEDDGPGIAPDFLPYAFDRFRQADSSSTRTHKGLGLGLAIVRHLVELHGGRVEAANRPGRGAVFLVRLPRRPGEPVVAVASPSSHADAPSLRGIRVMVVDDDADARDMIGAALEQRGASVLKLGSAVEALRALGEERPDVLLADVEMPAQDGYALLREIRSLSPEKGGLTPAAALTAYAGIEDRIRALSAGFDVHIPKPVQPLELSTVVARLAGQRR